MKGFTLIELLITIAIIGILSAIIAMNFINPPKQARDAGRKSDLSQYRTLLEAYANRSGSVYPSQVTAVNISSTLCTTLNGTGTCPEDPQGSAFYKYCSDTGGANYVLWASLESASSTFWTVCSDGRSGTSGTIPACGDSFSCNLP